MDYLVEPLDIYNILPGVRGSCEGLKCCNVTCTNLECAGFISKKNILE